MATKADILNHIVQQSQAIRASNTPESKSQADFLDQKIAQIKADPRHQDLSQEIGQPQQSPVQSQTPQVQQPQVTQLPIGSMAQQSQQSNTSDLTPEAVQSYQPQSQQSQQSQTEQFPAYGDVDIKKVIQQALGAGQALNPNIGQTIGGMLSTLGGGKPYVSPAQEIAGKAAEANLSMTPYKAMLMQSQYNRNNSSAESSQASVGQKQASGRLSNERADLLGKGGKLFDEAMNGGEGDNNPNHPNMQLSGFSATRGPSFRNLNEIAQEKGIGAIVKPWQQQNAKVDAGLHALRVMDQGFNQKTGQFNIASMNQGELNQSLGAIIAGQGPSSDSSREALRQSSLAGDVTAKINYMTGNTSNVVTPEIAKMIHQTLIGQVKQSATERQPYDEILQTKGNDPEQYFQKSPSYQFYYGNQGQQGMQQQGAMQFDPQKEARYQAWKAQQGKQ